MAFEWPARLGNTSEILFDGTSGAIVAQSGPLLATFARTGVGTYLATLHVDQTALTNLNAWAYGAGASGATGSALNYSVSAAGIEISTNTVGAPADLAAVYVAIGSLLPLVY